METKHTSDPERRRVHHRLFAVLAALFLLALIILWAIGLGPCWGTTCGITCCEPLPPLVCDPIPTDPETKKACCDQFSDPKPCDCLPSDTKLTGLEDVSRCCYPKPDDQPIQNWCCAPERGKDRATWCPLVCDPIPTDPETKKACCDQFPDPKPDWCPGVDQCVEKSTDPAAIANCCYNKPLEDQASWCCEPKPNDQMTQEWCCKPERNDMRPPWCLPTIVLPASVLFDFDEWKREDLKAEGEKELKRFADDLKGIMEEGQTVSIIGHTCRLGSEDYNQKLSERRASTIATYLKELLTERGLKDPKVKPIGMGESKPTGATEHCVSVKPYQKRKECFEPDRRVEICIDGQCPSQKSAAQTIVSP